MTKPDDADKAQDADEDSPTLEARVATKQAELLGTEVNVPVVEKEPAPEVIPEPEPETPIEPIEPELKSDEAKKEDEVMLPAGHRRAALARGWTAEEIDHYIETKPEEAQVTFRETFDAWQKENAEWSTRGRQLLAASKPSEDKKDEVDPSTPLAKLDVKALIEKHGDEDLINALVGPLNNMVDKLNIALDQVSHSQEFVSESKTQALAAEAQSFLMGDEMKPYRDMYGTEVKDLTEDQLKNRMALFAEGDGIVCGAVHHGKELSIHDALTRAHAFLSRGSRDAGIRAGIRDSLKKRTKTSRSPRQKAPPADTKNELVSDKELESRTDARLRELRNKR